MAGYREAFFRITRMRRLTGQETMEILRAAADGVSTSDLAQRYGVTSRAVRYTITADQERQADTAVATAGVTVKLTPEELEALDAVLASAGIASRAEGVRRLIQAAGGTFVPDAQLAAGMARYRVSLHEVGNGVVQIAKQMVQVNRSGQGAGGGPRAEVSELRLEPHPGHFYNGANTTQQAYGGNPPFYGERW